jgi:thiamine phosphate synthase YjbQ (UPF0047 family)
MFKNTERKHHNELFANAERHMKALLFELSDFLKIKEILGGDALKDWKKIWFYKKRNNTKKFIIEKIDMFNQ